LRGTIWPSKVGRVSTSKLLDMARGRGGHRPRGGRQRSREGFRHSHGRVTQSALHCPRSTLPHARRTRSSFPVLLVKRSRTGGLRGTVLMAQVGMGVYGIRWGYSSWPWAWHSRGKERDRGCREGLGLVLGSMAVSTVRLRGTGLRRGARVQDGLEAEGSTWAFLHMLPLQAQVQGLGLGLGLGPGQGLCSHP
jgi:hypothetical protein